MKKLLIIFLFLTTGLNAQVKFAMFGDYGCDEPPELAVSNLVKSWDPDFIVTLGDNNYYTYTGDSIDHNVGKYYHEYIKPYFGNYGSGSEPINRFFPALGNHDFYDFLWYGPGDLRYAGYAYYNFFKLTDTAIHKGNTPDQWSPLGVRYYTFRKGNVQFFIANSGASPDDHANQLFSEPDGVDSNSVQAQWFKTQLHNSTAKWKIVVIHHPPYSSVQPGLENAYRVLRWNFKQWGASAVLSGHNHIYESLVINGFPYFICGLGGEDVGEVQPSYPGSRMQYVSKFGSMLVTAYNDSLVFKFINIDNEIIDSYKLGTVQNDAGAKFASLVNSGIVHTGQTRCFYSQIKNYGSNDLFFVPVNYTVNGGPPIGPAATGAMYSGDSTSVTFCESLSHTFSVAGIYTMKFFTSLPGDTIHENDTATLILTVIDSSKDAGVIFANSVSEVSYTGSSVSLAARVKNYGLAHLPFVPVSYTVNGGAPVTIESGSINSNDTTLVTFGDENSFVPPVAGNYTLKFYTSLSGDTNHHNDTTTILLAVIDSSRDAGVISASTVMSEPFYSGTNISFNVSVKNFGVANLTSVPVSYRVEGDSNSISLNTVLLNSGDTASLQFADSNSFTPAAAGNYTLRFYTSLSGDTNFNNDTTTLLFTVIDSSRDAGILEVLAITQEPYYTGAAIAFRVSVKNFGIANLSSVKVNYRVDRDSNYVELSSEPINSGDTSILFINDSNSFVPSSAGSYVLKFYTAVTGDTNLYNDTLSLSLNVIDSVGTTIFISVIPQGYYDKFSAMLNQRDTLKAYLREVAPPHIYVDFALAVIDSITFDGEFRFSNAPNGNYYIVINHRNSIETWSEFSLNLITDPHTLHYYNFTNIQTAAFGGNLIKVDSIPERFAIFSGDVNQDGFVNLSDIILTSNDASNFLSGYVNSDITGDHIVNLNDIIIGFNNSNRFVSVIKP